MYNLLLLTNVCNCVTTTRWSLFAVLPCSLAASAPWPTSCCCSLAFSRIHSNRSMQHLVSCAQLSPLSIMLLRFIHVIGKIIMCPFLYWVIFHSVNICLYKNCLFIHLLMYIWVVSSFILLWIKLLWAFKCIFKVYFIDYATTIFPIFPPLSPLRPAPPNPPAFPILVHVHGLYI